MSGTNGGLRKEIGWDALVKRVARIRDSLPPKSPLFIKLRAGFSRTERAKN
jgi:hypothetical protein